MRLRSIRAFTLIELLVVISIIAMLMAILMPSLKKAKEQARQMVCMTNLHSIGHSIHVYAHDNEGRLVPGDFPVPWNVWAWEYGIACGSERKQVNLGYLMTDGTLPVPTNDESVFFCPSSHGFDGGRASECFVHDWGLDNSEASITYMFNNALDGFDSYLQAGERPVISHKNKINFLRGDGSVHPFNVRPLVFDKSVGHELLHEVSARYRVCFPTIMLHGWLENGAVDLEEAKDFLANPQGWAETNRTGYYTKNNSAGWVPRPVLVANVGTKSLVCDVVGVWGGTTSSPTPPPPS